MRERRFEGLDCILGESGFDFAEPSTHRFKTSGAPLQFSRPNCRVFGFNLSDLPFEILPSLGLLRRRVRELFHSRNRCVRAQRVDESAD